MAEKRADKAQTGAIARIVRAGRIDGLAALAWCVIVVFCPIEVEEGSP
jgi:hypothetical protein